MCTLVHVYVCVLNHQILFLKIRMVDDNSA